MRVFARVALFNLLALAGNDALAEAQTVAVRTLSAPTATFAEPFALVAGVREQSDGRVVVLDGHEIRIVRIDFRNGSITTLGRSGRGPGEYTLPVKLVALPGDTTLAMDMTGGGRALVITREGVSTSPLRSTRNERVAPIFSMLDIQADVRGRIYEMAMKLQMIDGRQMQTDSSAVRRIDRATGKQDTLGTHSRKARSPLIDPKPGRAVAATGAAPNARGTAPPPYITFDQWTVAPDGRIAIVTVDPYRVTYVSEDGRRTASAPIAYNAVKLTAALKEQWRELKSRPVSSIVYGPGGTVSGGRRTIKYEDPQEWPDVLPPFLLDALRFAPDGTLWIERTTDAGAPQTFDLVDRAGRLTSRVVLPPRSRLVGFGERTMYVVRIDDDDFEHLQRHNRP